MKLTDNLYFRLFLPFSASLLLATLAAWWIATSLLTSSLEQHLTKQLKHTAAVLSEGNFPFTRDLLIRLSRVIDADIFLIQDNGQLGPSTLETDQLKLQKLLLTQYKDWQSSDQQDGEYLATRFDFQNHPYQLVFHRVARERDPRYIAVAALTSLSAAHNSSRQVAQWLGITAFIGILLLAWIGHRIAQRFTFPVQELAKMARGITAGKRDVRAVIHHADEVGELAQTLNTMTEKLQFYENEIAQKSRLATVGEMATRIAHEIRNPLTAIKLQTQLLHESSSTSQQAITQKLLDEISRLELIVTGTLDVARPISLNIKNTQLNDLINFVTTLLAPQIQHRGIALNLALEQQLPTIPLDGDRIKQILLNLILNATDELKQGGKILISTHYQSDNQTDKNTIILTVEDSGPGIADHQIKEIFEPMKSGKTGGLGLGLAMSKELVVLHGGSIDAERSKLGGACFRIIFPIGIPDND